MIQEPRIIPECFGDTVWVKFIYEKTVLHGLGSGVANAMKKFPNGMMIGIIDDDKTKPTYFKEFIDLVSTSEGIELKHKPNSQHYIIIIKPAIEKWLLRMAAIGEVKHSYTFETLKKSNE